jgi:ABC-type Zn2+ transport system substrate-binding protein/surface adhesin
MTNYLNIMNRLTGMGDEMGTFIHRYIRSFQESLQVGVEDDNEVYQFILKEIEQCDNPEIKQAIEDKIKQAENYRKVKKASDLLRDILNCE